MYTEFSRSGSTNSLAQLQKYASSITKKSSNTQSQESCAYKYSQSEFVPFVKQRILGKLINKQNTLQNRSRSLHDKLLKKNITKENIISSITARNFKNFYRKEKKHEELNYARQTRASQQSITLSKGQWKQSEGFRRNQIQSFKSLKNQTRHKSSSKYPHERLLKKMMSKKQLTNNKKQLTNNKFQKQDIFLYKKIALQRPPTQNNPELNQLFCRYVSVCQLNQNIRRQSLTTSKKKDTFL